MFVKIIGCTVDLKFTNDSPVFIFSGFPLVEAHSQREVSIIYSGIRQHEWHRDYWTQSVNLKRIIM